MIKVFINGSSGTTGLRLRERMIARSDVELLEIDYEKRRDTDAVSELIAASDVSFLCLPDEAAIEAAATAGKTRIIDTSTAHRTNPAWAYGFPELSESHRLEISKSNRVAVPGCHASGFTALVYPLVTEGIIPVDYPLFCHSLTGYSGGGKVMIAEYDDPARTDEYSRPRQYAFTQQHKHLPEMKAVSGLVFEPVFTPVVEDFYSGMLVTIPIHTRMLPGKPAMSDLWSVYEKQYKNSALIKLMPMDNPAFLDAGGLTGRDDMEIYVTGSDERVLLAARFDNLGKGASGAALQCFNLMVGAQETAGLIC